MRDLHTYKDPVTGEDAALVADDVMEIIEANSGSSFRHHLRPRLQL